jgi:glutathione synthase/RimK-type ligase-like ATP-grasp enzyme
VIKRGPAARVEGQTLALSIGEVPEIVINTAVRAASLIGSGFYGVDLKQIGEQCYLIEVNDNPNVDAGNEDQVLQDALYRELMGVFARRIAARRRVTMQ